MSCLIIKWKLLLLLLLKSLYKENSSYPPTFLNDLILDVYTKNPIHPAKFPTPALESDIIAYNTISWTFRGPLCPHRDSPTPKPGVRDTPNPSGLMLMNSRTNFHGQTSPKEIYKSYQIYVQLNNEHTIPKAKHPDSPGTPTWKISTRNLTVVLKNQQPTIPVRNSQVSKTTATHPKEKFYILEKTEAVHPRLKLTSRRQS